MIAEYPDISFLVQHEIPYGEKDIPKPERSDTIVQSLNQYPVLKQSRPGDLGSSSKHNVRVKAQVPGFVFLYWQ